MSANGRQGAATRIADQVWTPETDNAKPAVSVKVRFRFTWRSLRAAAVHRAQATILRCRTPLYSREASEASGEIGADPIDRCLHALALVKLLCEVTRQDRRLGLSEDIEYAAAEIPPL